MFMLMMSRHLGIFSSHTESRDAILDVTCFPSPFAVGSLMNLPFWASRGVEKCYTRHLSLAFGFSEQPLVI